MMRMPRPLEAAILLTLATIVDRFNIGTRSESEILKALQRAGHHPSKNVFRLAMRRMEEDEMILKYYKLTNGYVYSSRELEDMVEGEFIKPDAARASTDVFCINSYYISKITGAFLERDEKPPAISIKAGLAAETYCQSAWGRSAYAN